MLYKQAAQQTRYYNGDQKNQMDQFQAVAVVGQRPTNAQRSIRPAWNTNRGTQNPMNSSTTSSSGGRSFNSWRLPSRGNPQPGAGHQKSNSKFATGGQWSNKQQNQVDNKQHTASTTEEDIVVPTYDLPPQPDITPYDPPKDVKVGVTHPRGILHEMHSQHVDMFPIVPKFEMRGSDGPSHRMNFTVFCEYGLETHKIHTQATASSKKDAKLKAAQKMVEKLKKLNVDIKIAPKCPKSSQNAIQDLKSNHMHPRGRLHEMHSTDCELFPTQPVFERINKPEKMNEFELEDASGPPHNRIFKILCKFSVKVGGEVRELQSTATAESKKRAQLSASKAMLELLKEIPEVTEWVEDIANNSQEFVPGKWFCKHCNTYMTGSQPFQAHLRGKQHQKKIHKLKLDEKEVLMKMWHRAYGNNDIPSSLLNVVNGSGGSPFGTVGGILVQPEHNAVSEPWIWPAGVELKYCCTKNLTRVGKCFWEETERNLTQDEKDIIGHFSKLSCQNAYMPNALPIDALKTLLPKKHVSVEVVNMYFRLMQKKYRDYKVVFFDTAFFKHLQNLRIGGMDVVRTYMLPETMQRLAGINYLTQAQAVIFPIYYEHKRQWMTCCLYPNRIALYNPNEQWQAKTETQVIYTLVSQFAQTAQYLSGQQPNTLWEWVSPTMEVLPQQRHERDSGIFAIVFAMCLAAGGGNLETVPTAARMKDVVRSRAFLSLTKELSQTSIRDQWFFGDGE